MWVSPACVGEGGGDNVSRGRGETSCTSVRPIVCDPSPVRPAIVIVGWGARVVVLLPVLGLGHVVRRESLVCILHKSALAPIVRIATHHARTAAVGIVAWVRRARTAVVGIVAFVGNVVHVAHIAG